MQQLGLKFLFLLPVLLGWILLAAAVPEWGQAAGNSQAAPDSGGTATAKPFPQAAAQTPGGADNAANATPARPPSEPYPLLSVPDISWQPLGQGIELGMAVIAESRANRHDAVFVFLRLMPEKHRFSLHMASHAGKPFSLPDWSGMGDLRAGINASMYLPDQITSTGYMRDGSRVNNAKMGGRLGAFFVAGRRRADVAHADVIEREQSDWRRAIEQYDLVVQNYRLISSGGKILWPTGGPEHSIAAIAKDDKGRILFILSQEPLTAVRFAYYLRSFALDLRTVMYVEGGAQAGLFVRLGGSELAGSQSLPGATAIPVGGDTVYVWKGRQSLLKLKGNPYAVLPNIIGVQRQ